MSANVLNRITTAMASSRRQLVKPQATVTTQANVQPQVCSFLEELKAAPARFVHPTPSSPVYVLTTMSSSLTDSVFTVKFEDSAAKFLVHGGLLSHYSAYYRARLEGRFEDGPTADGELVLPSSDLEGFEAFFSWLYTGRVCDNMDKLRGGAVPFWDALLPIHLFADLRCIPALKNAVADIVIDDFSTRFILPDAAIVNCIYANTVKSDRLRKLTVDIHTKSDTETSEVFNDDGEDRYPKDFLYNVCQQSVGSVNRQQTYLSKSEWAIVDKCVYHDHTDITKLGGGLVPNDH
jgi:hypothetical protein